MRQEENKKMELGFSEAGLYNDGILHVRKWSIISTLWL